MNTNGEHGGERKTRGEERTTLRLDEVAADKMLVLVVVCWLLFVGLFVQMLFISCR